MIFPEFHSASKVYLYQCDRTNVLIWFIALELYRIQVVARSRGFQNLWYKKVQPVSVIVI